VVSKLLWDRSPNGYAESVAFSPDGKRVAGSLKVWDTQTGQKLLTLQGHTGAIFHIVISPDGNRLASASADSVKIWDATPLPAKP